MKIGIGAGLSAKWLLMAVMAFGFSSAVMAQTISTSKHNLGSGSSGANKVSDTAEICVFCHTPHGGDVSIVGVPLWNKRLTTGATYSTYSSSTMNAAAANDGTSSNSNTGQIGSVSLACLSCHDGTQAMDNILNAPGSGNYDATGGTTAGLGYTWTETRSDADGKLSGIANLGNDLSNDHPIGIQYCGGGYTTGSGTGSCADSDFFAPTNAVIGGTRVFWVDSGTAPGTRDKGDMILYNRTFVGGTVGPSVECASCHDPHNAANGTFLRKANTGSAVCLACHNK